MTMKNKPDVLAEDSTMMEKISLGSELVKTIIKLRTGITERTENIDEAI